MKIRAVVHPENSPLTRKENEVLAMLAEGRTRPEIAAELHRSFQTINTHMHHILTKLDADTNVHAVAIAVLRNMLSFQRALCLCLAVSLGTGAVVPAPVYAGDLFGLSHEEPLARVRSRQRGGVRVRVRSGRREVD